LAQKPLAERDRIHSNGSQRAVCHMLRQKCANLPAFRSDIPLRGFLVCGYTVNMSCLQGRSAVRALCGMRGGLNMCRNRPQQSVSVRGRIFI